MADTSTKRIQKILQSSVFFAAILLCFFAGENKAEAACQVTDADWRTGPGAPYPNDDFTYPTTDPATDNRTTVYVDIQSTGCIGSSVNITIRNMVSFFSNPTIMDVNVANDTPISVTNNDFTLAYKATNEGCTAVPSFNPLYSNLINNALATGGLDATWDCVYVIGLEDSDGLTWYEYLQGEAYNDHIALSYDCYGTLGCEWDPINWTFLAELPYETFHDQDIFANDPPVVFEDGYGELDESYLAPLPGLSNATPPENRLKGFLQGMFQVLIIIAGILAVIMIVIGAVTYLSTDAFSGKSEGKEMMLNAVFGLVLALGGWIIINTINPKLASELSITIPIVRVDDPRKEWQNGNAPAGTNIAIGETVNSQPVVQGASWPSDATQRQELANGGVTINKPNCPNSGSSNCTSVYFEGPAVGVIQDIIDLKTACACDVTVTGGSEAWLHTTHGPNKKVIDFDDTQSLNTYLRALPGGPTPGSSFPAGKTVNISDVGRFKAEGAGDNVNTTGPHWHVTFY